MKPAELLVYVVVAQLIDGQQALQACIHIAIQTIIFEADYAFLKLLDLPLLLLR